MTTKTPIPVMANASDCVEINCQLKLNIQTYALINAGAIMHQTTLGEAASHILNSGLDPLEWSNNNFRKT